MLMALQGNFNDFTVRRNEIFLMLTLDLQIWLEDSPVTTFKDLRHRALGIKSHFEADSNVLQERFQTFDMLRLSAVSFGLRLPGMMGASFLVLPTVEGELDVPVDFPIPAHFPRTSQYGRVSLGFRILSFSYTFLM